MSRRFAVILAIGLTLAAACKRKPATPPNVIIRVGDRMLALEADGYVTVARRVTVQGGETASVNVALEAQPTTAPTP